MQRQQARVEVRPGLHLAYASQGDTSGPAVVFFPGPTDSWRSYDAVLHHFPPSVHAVAVSARGHGDSDKPEAGYSVQDYAADVVPFLTAIGLRRVVLAGHSASCLVVRRVAAESPERVAGLVLEASPLTLYQHPEMEDFVATAVSNLSDPVSPGFVRTFLSGTAPRDQDPAAFETHVEQLLKVPARVWQGTFGGLVEYDDAGLLGRIQTSVLLLWGEADRRVGLLEQEALTTAIPHAELRVYAGVGHIPRMEDPSRFAADVTAFVTSLAT
ncbi:alpha/beta hydrolase [Citricoccus sp. I39-566]|uniref:alpha/beta fold hydrolase n=1 Tax=Citricoccus sp. I39-566 TaxID=3073268 RepID=UPI00286BAD5A|nr:alpha/beta hydrolase [Citricoccus sp. I39-566]WMY79368.1 alpha/beta hydrolase [Citricoccus sp. I39-566]